MPLQCIEANSHSSTSRQEVFNMHTITQGFMAGMAKGSARDQKQAGSQRQSISQFHGYLSVVRLNLKTRCLYAVSASFSGRRSGSMPRSRMKLMIVSSPTPS